jgi:hypothetical protein
VPKLGLVYDARVRLDFAIIVLLGVGWASAPLRAQDGAPAKTEPKYDGTFSGAIVELSAEKITVSRSILGKPPEKRTFLIQSDTRVEGKLRLKLRVTVGFVASSDGDVARLIVARPQKPPAKK